MFLLEVKEVKFLQKRKSATEVMYVFEMFWKVYTFFLYIFLGSKFKTFYWMQPPRFWKNPENLAF